MRGRRVGEQGKHLIHVKHGRVTMLLPRIMHPRGGVDGNLPSALKITEQGTQRRQLAGCGTAGSACPEQRGGKGLDMTLGHGVRLVERCALLVQKMFKFHEICAVRTHSGRRGPFLEFQPGQEGRRPIRKIRRRKRGGGFTRHTCLPHRCCPAGGVSRRALPA